MNTITISEAEPPLTKTEARRLYRDWSRKRGIAAAVVRSWLREILHPPVRTGALMSLSEARDIAGPLSYSRKMPGPSWGIPVDKCPTGSKLAQISGTICACCNMKKGQSAWPNAIRSQRKRLAGFVHRQWKFAMITLILAESEPRFVDLGRQPGPTHSELGRHELKENDAFRIFDVGDLQSIEMLRAWCEVAEEIRRRKPRHRFWLETKELQIVKDFVRAGGVIPKNMNVRVSAIWPDDQNPRRDWPRTSSVFERGPPPPGSFVCEAPSRGHRCGDCRACWNPKIKHIAHPYDPYAPSLMIA